ncbi:CRISPR-associated protein Cas4 [Sphingomonas sp.]|uniref:CRISPR-associated protein Cas4 n=1 Tax=Sphingomonas sp. TaxID=28214 RepID=UPI0035BC82C0
MEPPAPPSPTPGAIDEDDLVPISALQHQLFCPRQCALIHLEQQWLEDGATAEGRILHERVDDGGADKRRGVRTVRGIALRSMALGVTGKADAVELHGRAPDLRPYPVEYKRGQPKTHRADDVQLCAQAMCLEEMFGAEVPEGALFYARLRRRTAVAFDAELRALTTATALAVRTMLESRITPAPVPMPGCARCSLEPLCRPDAIAARRSVERWLARQLAD